MNVTGSQQCLKIVLTPVAAVTSRDERLVIVPILTSSTLANSITIVGFWTFCSQKISYQ